MPLRICTSQAPRLTIEDRMSRRALLWLIPVVVAIHNLEEALFMPRFLQARNGSIPGPLQTLLPAISYKQFLTSLIIVTAIPYMIASFGRLKRRDGRGVPLLLGVQVVMLINVFAHITMAILVNGYAPGLATALLLNLPFSIYLLRRAYKEEWMEGRAMVMLFPIGLLIHAVGLPALIVLSGSF